jgi:hypothetical protein
MSLDRGARAPSRRPRSAARKAVRVLRVLARRVQLDARRATRERAMCNNGSSRSCMANLVGRRACCGEQLPSFPRFAASSSQRFGKRLEYTAHRHPSAKPAWSDCHTPPRFEPADLAARAGQRSTSTARGRAPPAPGAMSYSFPVLENDELLPCLEEMEIPINAAQLAKPTYEVVGPIFENILVNLTGITRWGRAQGPRRSGGAGRCFRARCLRTSLHTPPLRPRPHGETRPRARTRRRREELNQPVFAAIDAFEYPELHDESIAARSFFAQLSRLMAVCGVRDFGMKARPRRGEGGRLLVVCGDCRRGERRLGKGACRWRPTLRRGRQRRHTCLRAPACFGMGRPQRRRATRRRPVPAAHSGAAARGARPRPLPRRLGPLGRPFLKTRGPRPPPQTGRPQARPRAAAAPPVGHHQLCKVQGGEAGGVRGAPGAEGFGDGGGEGFWGGELGVNPPRSGWASGCRARDRPGRGVAAVAVRGRQG